MGKINRLILCKLLDRPEKCCQTIGGKFRGKGDYGDQWSWCLRCKGLIHRDNHVFGDGIWRHE